jgi:hypothetical protein
MEQLDDINDDIEFAIAILNVLPKGSRKKYKDICEHGRRMTRCAICDGSYLCSHGREKYQCKKCGTGLCEHGTYPYTCRICKDNKCIHGRIKLCKICRIGYCQHDRLKRNCIQCINAKFKRTKK